MEKETLKRKIQDEIENATERKMRYTMYLKGEIQIIADYCSDSKNSNNLLMAIKMVKAHAEKMDSYMHSIIESDCKLDSLEWMLDEIEEGGTNE